MTNRMSRAVRWALCLAGLVVVVALTGCGRATTTSSVSVKRPVTSTASTGTIRPVFGNQWVEIALLNGDTYFGRIRAYGTDSVLLWDVYYPTARGKAQDTVLSKMGKELHKPQQMMVIPVRSLQSWQELGDKSKVLAAIRASGDKGIAPPTDKSVESGKAYAVFLQDGRVLFGGVQRGERWTGVVNGYYLSRKDPKAKPDAPIASLNDLQLVPQTDAQLGRGPVLWLHPDSVLFYEPLADDSPVVTALAALSKK